MSAVLGFDTATSALTVAVSRGDEVLREMSEGPGPDGRPLHSARLLGEVEESVRAAGGWDAIGRIAVGVGPGSFTGLRIGISTARALAQARDLPLAAVSTLAALARAIGELPGGEGRPLLAVIDARRGQAFAAVFEGDGREVRPPGVYAPDQLRDLARSLDSPPFAAGNGALLFAEQLTQTGATVVSPDDPVHQVAARHICALGAEAPESPPEQVEPAYLREPDAKRWIERDGGTTGD
jgi:tRNA threonylcarbamoyladenosine biosynthesis protein TsaB